MNPSSQLKICKIPTCLEKKGEGEIGGVDGQLQHPRVETQGIEGMTSARESPDDEVPEEDIGGREGRKEGVGVRNGAERRILADEREAKVEVEVGFEDGGVKRFESFEVETVLY